MKDLLKRSVAGFVYVILIIAGTIIHPYVFAPIFGTILFLTLSEFYTIAANNNKTSGYLPAKIIGLLLFVLLFLTANKILPPSLVYLSIPLFLSVYVIELLQKGSDSLIKSAVSISGILYVALPIGLLNFIIIPGNAPGSGFYPWILVGIFLIIWVYDSMAYVSGSLLGKHKIAPAISPGKSWEGFFGGTVFAVAMGILNAALFPVLSMMSWIIVALLAVVFGTLGDFFESKLKREAGIKDSGNLIPGHGGLLDRLDSLLFAIPVIFVWLNLFCGL